MLFQLLSIKSGSLILCHSLTICNSIFMKWIHCTAQSNLLGNGIKFWDSVSIQTRNWYSTLVHYLSMHDSSFNFLFPRNLILLNSLEAISYLFLVGIFIPIFKFCFSKTTNLNKTILKLLLQKSWTTDNNQNWNWKRNQSYLTTKKSSLRLNFLLA